MQNGYHTAKVEWIKDEPVLEEELGNLKIDFIIKFLSEVVGNRVHCVYSLCILGRNSWYQNNILFKQG